MPTLVTDVFISTSFIAFHRWPEAPDHCSFLRNMHRHVFHVKMAFNVSHLDRHIEFITMKKRVDDFIDTHYRDVNLQLKSCEMIAEELCKYFDASMVMVSEDDENGAIVRRI